MVRRHVETGRISLYANPYHITRILGLGVAESVALIAELTDHMVATTAQYRHKWQVGDIVIWDNRCALHSATGGYPIEEQRIHWRVTIMQDATEQRRAA
jgi:taurine dioxygenase